MGGLLAALLFCLTQTCQTSGYSFDPSLEFYRKIGNAIGSELTLPEVPSPTQEGHWPRRPLALGQVSGVAVDLDNRPQLFHRGNVTWHQTSFNMSHQYQHVSRGPIAEPTLLTLDPVTGAVLKAEGAGRYYLPHGLHIDARGNRWLTDVALHQVFKLPPDGDVPAMTLGVPFSPGHDERHFCQPADVAVADDGTIFVADGYCGRRVAVFNTHGRYLGSFGESEGVSLRVPHSLALQGDVLCVADREHGRLVCWDAGRQRVQPRVTSLSLYGRLFAVCAAGDVLYSVHQNQYGSGALTIDLASGSVLTSWSSSQGLQEPHDIAVGADGGAIYIGETDPHRVTKFLVQPDFYQRQ